MPNRKTVVLVEGETDRQVLQLAVAKCDGLNDRVTVEGATRPPDGEGGFARKLRALLDQSGFLRQTRKFVILRDTDDTPAKSFAAAADAFAGVGLPRPVQPGIVAAGTYETSEGYPVEVESLVVLVPGPDQPGNLETLMLGSLDGHRRLGCVDELVACWQGDSFVLPEKTGNADRLRMQVWLAQFVDKRGYIHLGASMKATHVKPLPWNFDHPAFAPLLAQLRAL